jgi:hypothetical protein
VEELAQRYICILLRFIVLQKHLGSPEQYLDIVRYYTFVGSLQLPLRRTALLDSMQGYYDRPMHQGVQTVHRRHPNVFRQH